MNLWWVFGIGVVLAIVTSLLQRERTAGRIVLTAVMGGLGAWVGMAVARGASRSVPPTQLGVFAAAVVGAVVVLAIEQITITREVRP